MTERILGAAAYLEELADTLERWAEESRRGGWSTHQVAANQREANRCRREASSLRRVAQELAQ